MRQEILFANKQGNQFIKIQQITRLTDALYSLPMSMNRSQLRDSLSFHQLASKQWLMTKFMQFDSQFRNVKQIHHLGSWHGLLSAWISEHLDNGCVTNLVEPDKIALDLSSHVHYGLNKKCFNTSAEEYTSDKTNNVSVDHLVLNTSCEHMSKDWFDNLPMGTHIVAQSTNSEADGHINTQESLGSFAEQLPMATVTYAGILKMDSYNSRFMLIGTK